MGCCSNKNENQSEKIILLKKLKEKVLQLIKANPFYSISIKDFNKFMAKQKTYSFENISKNITDTYIKEDDIIYSIFKNVSSFSYTKFKYLFHSENFDEKIKTLIFYFIFLFLTENQSAKNNILLKKINKLFDKIKIKEENRSIQFRTGKFSFLLLNLIQFHTFCFIYFFCSRGVLQKIGNINKNEIKIIYSNQFKSEKYKPNNINKILNQSLYYLNKNIQPDKVNYIILADILQPLSEYISENKNVEIFSISQVKYKEIIDILIEKMNHNYYLELFFKLYMLILKNNSNFFLF